MDKDGWSPLHLAAEKGRHEAVQALADAGAPLDAISHEHGLTALHQACAFGHVKACEVLIKAGALMQVRDARAQSPLHIAAANGHAGVIDTLLKHAPRDLTSHLIATGNILGFTPLHLACENGHEMATKILLARGAPPDTTCKALYTPSHQAAMSGSVPTLRAVVAGSKGSMIARAKVTSSPQYARRRLPPFRRSFSGHYMLFATCVASTMRDRDKRRTISTGYLSYYTLQEHALPKDRASYTTTRPMSHFHA